MSVKTLIVDDDKAVQFFHKMTVKRVNSLMSH
ncbi:hypothetical protein BH11BAC3_BH11BAC3_00830 [soil metagenome]